MKSVLRLPILYFNKQNIVRVKLTVTDSCQCSIKFGVAVVQCFNQLLHPHKMFHSNIALPTQFFQKVLKETFSYLLSTLASFSWMQWAQYHLIYYISNPPIHYQRLKHTHFKVEITKQPVMVKM